MKDNREFYPAPYQYSEPGSYALPVRRTLAIIYVAVFALAVTSAPYYYRAFTENSSPGINFDSSSSSGQKVEAPAYNPRPGQTYQERGFFDFIGDKINEKLNLDPPRFPR